MKNILIYLSLPLMLIACGGSSTTNPIDNSAPTPLINNAIIAIDDNLSNQQAVELILFYPNKKISNINWQQLSGPMVNFLTPTSKVIAFTPQESGEYQFKVSFLVNGSAQQTLTKSINVANDNSLISARLGQSALEGNKVSLRAWLDPSLEPSSVTWQQISGPSVLLKDYKKGDLAIFFTAPAIEQDTLVEFKVKASNSNNTYTDTVAILIENTNNIINYAYFNQRIAKVFPYHSNSPYGNNLVKCLYSNQLKSSCTLADIPLIAQKSLTPSVDDIMDRVVVSHQWMGDRFKDFLENYDSNNDFKNLLRATTGVVISYDIRPSFYWAATGAIYLDANNFWLTPDERDTINEAPDYRAAFGKKLQFVMPWRYVKNNAYVSRYIAANKRINRSIDDGVFRLTSLLFHELAHANDSFPSTEWANYSSDTRVYDARQKNDLPSNTLAIRYPLQSSEMRDLAQVSFAGNNANYAQKAYLPSDIATFFKPDIASDYYNYSSKQEDFATLFDEVMMYTRYKIQRDVAITNRPQGEQIFANDYIVAWGQRGRIGEENIKDRASFVLKKVLPELDNSAIINALPAPTPMVAGDDWVKNLTLSDSTLTPLSVINSEQQRRINQNNITRPINQVRYYQKSLPQH